MNTIGTMAGAPLARPSSRSTSTPGKAAWDSSSNSCFWVARTRSRKDPGRGRQAWTTTSVKSPTIRSTPLMAWSRLIEVTFTQKSPLEDHRRMTSA